MTWNEQFTAWLKSLVRFSVRVIIFDFDETAGRFSARMFTPTHEYGLSATSTYLGCVVSERTPRPGESWTRGNDLADGPFGEETWLRILTDIVAYELQPIVESRDEVECSHVDHDCPAEDPQCMCKRYECEDGL